MSNCDSGVSLFGCLFVYFVLKPGLILADERLLSFPIFGSIVAAQVEVYKWKHLLRR